MRRLLPLMLLLSLVLPACGGGEETAEDPGSTAQDSATSGVSDDGTRPADGVTPGAAVGPGISVGEAIDFDGDEPVLVNGYLFVDTEGNATLASTIAESFPPQPGGDTLRVEGLDLTEFDFSEEQGIRWTDDRVQILGTVDGGVLVHGDTPSA